MVFGKYFGSILYSEIYSYKIQNWARMFPAAIVVVEKQQQSTGTSMDMARGELKNYGTAIQGDFILLLK